MIALMPIYFWIKVSVETLKVAAFICYNEFSLINDNRRSLLILTKQRARNVAQASLNLPT